MGSVSKSLTGVAIMQLVEQGKIDLDAPVTDYLPYFEMVDDRYKDITVRQLLSHKSGLYDEFGHELNDSLEPVEQAVRDLADQRLRSRPGKFYFYTGVGFALLGDIISKVSGMDFEDYMQENILVPLGMNHSTFVPEKADPELLFTPHTNEDDGSVVITRTELCDIRRQAECTLHSSCEDMMRFAMFSLNQGEIDGVSLLSHEGFDQMWTSHADTGGIVLPIYGPPIAQYGLSWQLGEVDGHRLVGHAGGGTGVNTQLLLAPDDDLAVITMANWAQEWPWPASFTAIDVIYSLLGIEEGHEKQMLQIMPAKCCATGIVTIRLRRACRSTYCYAHPTHACTTHGYADPAHRYALTADNTRYRTASRRCRLAHYRLAHFHARRTGYGFGKTGDVVGDDSGRGICHRQRHGRTQWPRRAGCLPASLRTQHEAQHPLRYQEHRIGVDRHRHRAGVPGRGGATGVGHLPRS